MIVFFDGHCNLCNSSIDFLIRRDKKRRLKYASLQGQTASRLLSDEQRSAMDSLYLFDEETKVMLSKSTAWFAIMNVLGGPWLIMNIFRIVPRFISDWVYDMIAANRFKIWGKRETCRLPTPEEREYLLD